MTINEYLIGQQIRLASTFSDSDGLNTNPTAVVLTVRAPDGTKTTPAAINSATGHYYADITPTAAGEWHYRWAGTGACGATSSRCRCSCSRWRTHDGTA